MDARDRRRRGFALLEMLATIAILGVLASLVIAAAMRARSAARGLDCRSRLRQIGVAMATYADAFGRFAPTGDDSLWVALTPWLGAGPDGVGMRRDGGFDFAVHAAVANFLRCPAMIYGRPVRPATAAGLVDVDHAAVSYVGNAGKFVWDNYDSRDHDAGGTVTARGVRPAEIVDGLSRTALIGELLATVNQSDWDAGRNTIHRVVGATSGSEVVALCLAGQIDSSSNNPEGHRFTTTTMYGDALYCHGVPPGPMSYILDDTGLPRSSAIAAASNHDNAVNVLHCDGSVQWYSYTIALPIWQALGTRAGAEAF